MQPDGNTHDDPARTWIYEWEDLQIMGVRNWRRKTKGSGPMVSNRGRGQSSLWTVAPTEEKAHDDEEK
jgi:hypothetical protein